MKDYYPIECSIDDARLANNWDDVKLSLEEYSQIFDEIYDVNTKYHRNLREMKTYYWIVMAEYNFFCLLDFHAAMDCVRRAIAFDVSNVFVRLLVAKMVLHICQPTLLSLFPCDRRLKINSERFKMKNFILNKKLTLETILGNHHWKVFSYTSTVIAN